MKLFKLEIEGFRLIKNSTLIFGDTTFFIGENNVGKSSAIKAIEKFINADTKCEDQDFYTSVSGEKVNQIVLTGTYIGLPDEAFGWRGFKGRILKKKINNQITNTIEYRKAFLRESGQVKREMKVNPKKLKKEFENLNNLNDFQEKGVSKKLLEDAFGLVGFDRKLTNAQLKNLEKIEDVWEYDETKEEWFENPGGIEGNISIKLPNILLIPAEHRINELNQSSGALQQTMKTLFKDIRDVSENYKKAQEYLELLSKELDPNDHDKEFGKMLNEVNSIISDVFSDTKLYVETKLSDPNTALNPTFDVEMSSNVKTNLERQGMGSIRTAVFALLKYRQKFLENKREKTDEYQRNLVICFEEPEIYLHPNAANLMRENIYNLATSSNTQIISSTHSPYMIDLSKDLDKSKYPNQILNLFKLDSYDKQNVKSDIIVFNVTQSYDKLMKDEKEFVKFIIKMDDYVSRVFFAKNILICEGDTEEIVLRETIRRLDPEIRKDVLSNYQIIKARGKASIIALVKYLKSLSLQPKVIHDEDKKEGATKFNEPIKEALGGENFRYMFKYCIEDVLGYEPPSVDKPYTAYKYINDNWGEKWDDITEKWKKISTDFIFKESFK